MGTQGIVVQPGEGLVSNSSTTPGRSYALKLLGSATGDSRSSSIRSDHRFTARTSHITRLSTTLIPMHVTMGK